MTTEQQNTLRTAYWKHLNSPEFHEVLEGALRTFFEDAGTEDILAMQLEAAESVGLGDSNWDVYLSGVKIIFKIQAFIDDPH